MATLEMNRNSDLNLPKIAMTGASGRIGSKLIPILNADFRILEIPPGATVPSGCDGLIHLAGNSDMDQPWSEVVESGVKPVLNYLEAVRRARVPQFIYASSCFVVDMQSGRKLDKIPVDIAPCPQTPYGLGKSYCEAFCRYYAETHGMTVDVLRMGWVIGVYQKPTYYPIVLDIFCDIRDLSTLIKRLFQVEHKGFNSFYAISKGTLLKWDFENAQELLNYRPRHHVFLRAGLQVIRDFLRRLPGILCRGMLAILRNRLYGKPEKRVAKKSREGRISFACEFPRCDHPCEPAFLNALDQLYSFLADNEAKHTVVTFGAKSGSFESTGGSATQELFSNLALLTVNYFINRGHSVEIK